jgi:carbohydrate-binding DOMON domain-containing protein
MSASSLTGRNQLTNFLQAKDYHITVIMATAHNTRQVILCARQEVVDVVCSQTYAFEQQNVNQYSGNAVQLTSEAPGEKTQFV